MSKKLNITEAMKMPIGTEFEVFSTLNRKADVNMILRENENNKKYLEWVDNEPLKVFEFLMDTTFIPIQQPVSFMEVVKSDKKCKVEHKLMNCHFDEYSFNLKGYKFFSNVMETLGDVHTSRELRKIILEGKWYIEEIEADSND